MFFSFFRSSTKQGNTEGCNLLSSTYLASLTSADLAVWSYSSSVLLRLLFDKHSDSPSWDKENLSLSLLVHPYTAKRMFSLLIITQLRRCLFNLTFNRFCYENTFVLSEYLNHRLPTRIPPFLEHHDQLHVYQVLPPGAVCFSPSIFLWLLTGMLCPSLWPSEYLFSFWNSAPVILYSEGFCQPFSVKVTCSFAFTPWMSHTDHIVFQSFFLWVGKLCFKNVSLCIALKEWQALSIVFWINERCDS